MKEIRITCAGAGTIELERVVGLQGNLKTINRKNLEKLKSRILKHGFNVPYHIWIHDGAYYLLDGHQRTRALLEFQAQGYEIPPLPYDTIEARDLADAKDKLLGISSQYGDFTVEGLQDFTAGIDLDIDLRLPSGEFRLETIKAGAEEDAGEDDIPEAAPKISKPGDLWELGPHRLKVGDSTSAKDVASLFGRQAAQLVFTDPPYGVDYDSAEGGILNDEKKGIELEKLLAPAFKLAAKHAMEDAAFYVWHASATRVNFERALIAAGLEEKQYLIWVKPAPVLGRSHYQWAHEPCFYCGRQGITPRWSGDRKQSTVWEVASRNQGSGFIAIGSGVALVADDGSHIFIQRNPPKSKKVRSLRIKENEPVLIATMEGSDIWHVSPDSRKEYIHPNQKPVELSARAIINNTEPGEVVYDAFTGSGSTLIGCQRTGRVFLGMELDPKWADLIIKRWAKWVFDRHMEPVVKRNGETFEWQTFIPEL